MARVGRKVSLRGWVFATLAFFAAALAMLALELLMGRGSRTTVTRSVARSRGAKGGILCRYEYVVHGQPFEISGECDDGIGSTVDYLPTMPTLARMASRRGEYGNIALILALVGLGSLA